jgi:hypothetical protein
MGKSEVNSSRQPNMQEMSPASGSPLPLPGSRAVPAVSLLDRSLSRLFAEMLGPEVTWTRTTYVAFSALITIWAALMFSTWATWGNLTIDCGHEMYVPAVLSEGKKLYRDVWFMYGPAAPYLNSFLFRLFGVHLNVLYWAGSLSALGSAAFLYLAGMRLGSWVIGWAAGAVVLIQAFQPGLFCFPLPFSFAAVYGCLTACLFLWLVLRASTSTGWAWVFGAGTTAAAALLLKPEIGVACYLTLVPLIAVRSLLRQSRKSIMSDFVAILPGIVICGLVIRWMVSIAGAEFITQENIVSWPTSLFMRTYGKMWLERTGFTITGAAFAAALYRTSHLAGVALGFYCILRRTRSDGRSIFLGAEICVVVLACLARFLPWQAQEVFRWVFFPRDMVLFVAVAASLAWWYFWRERSLGHSPAVALSLTFASLLAFRILMGMQPAGYSIYYNGPVVLSYQLLLARLIIPRPARLRLFVAQAEVLVCFGCLMAVAIYSSSYIIYRMGLVPLTTERGTIRVSKRMAKNYQEAIAFMKEKAAVGESVLSVPEDTSLYFLSGTHCPTRLYSFTPGILVPGKMTDEVIQELEWGPTRYLIWSNRDFPEYPERRFGTDFDRTLGDYLRSHYRPLRPLIPNDGPGWSAVVWERIPQGGESR